MTTIKTIDGTKIFIRNREHNPPHVHVKNAEHECLIYIKTFKIEGIPPKNIEEVLEWMILQEDYLMKKWVENTGLK